MTDLEIVSMQIGFHKTIKALQDENRLLKFDLDKERGLRREAEDKDMQVRRNKELKTALESHQTAHWLALASVRSGLAELENLYGRAHSAPKASRWLRRLRLLFKLVVKNEQPSPKAAQ